MCKYAHVTTGSFLLVCCRSVESGMEHRAAHLSMCSAKPPGDWGWQGTSPGEAEAIMAALQAAAG